MTKYTPDFIKGWNAAIAHAERQAVEIAHIAQEVVCMRTAQHIAEVIRSGKRPDCRELAGARNHAGRGVRLNTGQSTV